MQTEFYEGEQVLMFDQDLWSSKTSAESSVRTAGKTSKPSSRKSSGSSNQTLPTFLYLEGDGTKPDAFMEWVETGNHFPSVGEFIIQSFGELPREEFESRLSQILEQQVPEKYFLSEKACLGIIRRANGRGKALPEVLETALKEQIEWWRAKGKTSETDSQNVHVERERERESGKLQYRQRSASRCDEHQQGSLQDSQLHGRPDEGSDSGIQGDEEAVIIENHPNDSRVKIKHDGIVQALSSRMGTGGNNTPLAMIRNDSQIVNVERERESGTLS